MEEIREMDGARDLAADGLDNARMRVSKAVNGDATKKIEIFFAGGIEYVAAAPMREDDGLAASHQYDVSDFFETLKDGNMPSVSYLKPTTAQSGHPGESDPLDEQKFIVNTVNKIEKSKYWPSTAIVLTYDDSDGWYDHVAPTLTNGSDNSSIDTTMCENTPVTVGTTSGRCGSSQRLPMIVISPWTQINDVSNDLTDTTSVVKFIENNWLRGERIPGSFDATSGSLDAPGGLLDFNVKPHVTPLILNPTTGAVVGAEVAGAERPLAE